jgi:branched-subunit amino acid aminotransferase/4-amino-4-deoxychorismate lyase
MPIDMIVARLNEAGGIENLDVPDGVTDLNKISQWLPEGAYTTFRTYEHVKALWLNKHYQRLEETASLADRPVRLDTNRISVALRKLLLLRVAEDSRVRLTVDLSSHVGDIYIALVPLVTPGAMAYQNGVHVITCNIEKRENPKAKLTNFITRAENIRHQLPADVEEALIVNGGGQILEGLSSNFFAVKGKRLWVADDGALSGLTMKLVLEEADRLKIAYQKKGISIHDLGGVSEAFITSASRAILPVTRIDNESIGDGRVGQMTRTLMKAYQLRLADEIDAI